MKGFTYGAGGFMLLALFLGEKAAGGFYTGCMGAWLMAHYAFDWFHDGT